MTITIPQLPTDETSLSHFRDELERELLRQTNEVVSDWIKNSDQKLSEAIERSLKQLNELVTSALEQQIRQLGDVSTSYAANLDSQFYLATNVGHTAGALMNDLLFPMKETITQRETARSRQSRSQQQADALKIAGKGKRNL